MSMIHKASDIHEEQLLDQAVEQTFPASDPIAGVGLFTESAVAKQTIPSEDKDESLLDGAIELTFPASDPIAVTPHDKLFVMPRL